MAARKKTQKRSRLTDADFLIPDLPEPSFADRETLRFFAEKLKGSLLRAERRPGTRGFTYTIDEAQLHKALVRAWQEGKRTK